MSRSDAPACPSSAMAAEAGAVFRAPWSQSDAAGICLADPSGRVRYVSHALRGRCGEPAASSESLADVVSALAVISLDDAKADVERVIGGDPPVERQAASCSTRLSLLSDDGGAPLLLMFEAQCVGRADTVLEEPPGYGSRATYDPLTALPNRTTFMERLSALLKNPGRPDVVAVMFIDLDDFKDINDGHGHQRGDDVLIETARRLGGIFRPRDTVTRLGGDEFVVICVDLASEDEAARIASRALVAISQPILVGDDEMVVTSSIGIAIARSGAGASADAVLHEADSAMYRAKARGKNQIEVFDDALRQTTNNRLSTESLLRRALRDELFRLHYQPIYELATGELTAVESLLRLDDPDQGLLSPAKFIDVAEQSGLIVPIGAWVLQEACRQLAEWRAGGVVGRRARVAVNLSARQVSRSDLLKTVCRALEDARLEPSALSLELTESIFMDADSIHVRQLETLRAMGVTIEIDDFGTGYSSLGYLKRLPVGVVKVDQSFVAGMLTNPADYGIVSSVVGLGQALGLVTIAEGVETAEQLDALWVLGCDQAQGYFLGRPSPASRPPLAVTDWGEPAIA